MIKYKLPDKYFFYLKTREEVYKQAYFHGVADTQFNLLNMMTNYPQTYIDFIKNKCIQSAIPTYEQAIIKLREKYNN